MKTLLAILTLWFPFVTFGQNISTGSPADQTWSLGYGIINEMLPEGQPYEAITFLGKSDVQIWGRLALYAEYQFTQASSTPNIDSDYEFGLNLGLQFRQPITDALGATVAVGSGPHFITVETGKQANGFIFSDNFEAGIQYHIASLNTTIVAKGRYRHISNAGLAEPNGGIDNFFLVLGFGAGF